MLALTLFLFLSATPVESQAGGLEDRIEGFWEAVARGDRYQALVFVHPEQRRNFLSSGEPLVQEWSLSGIERVSETKARVKVHVRSQFPGSPGDYSFEVFQQWIRLEEEWYLEVPVPSPREINQAIYGESDEIQPGRLELIPDALVLHFLNPVQKGRFRLSNGTNTQIEVVSLQVESPDFIVSPSFEGPLASMSRGYITVHYTGRETAKDLTTRLRVGVRSSGSVQELVRVIHYNHIGGETRVFFGLTEEEARDLSQDDALRPAIPGPERSGSESAQENPPPPNP